MRTTQRKGDIAVACAIATFTKMGYDVSVPLTESAKYDLVVDTGEALVRVQVKYTSNGIVDLRSVHSNSKGYKVKKTEANDYDWLYIVHKLESEFAEHLIKECLVGRNSIRAGYNTLVGC